MIGLDDGPDGLHEDRLPAETEARLQADSAALAQRTVAAMHAEEHITAATLIATARMWGVTALGVAPRAGDPCKVLLGSLMLDVRDEAVQQRLVQLNREGAIHLTRVDAVGLIPADRRAVYDRGCFYSLCCWFDAISWDGAALLGSDVVGAEPIVVLDDGSIMRSVERPDLQTEI